MVKLYPANVEPIRKPAFRPTVSLPGGEPDPAARAKMGAADSFVEDPYVPIMHAAISEVQTQHADSCRAIHPTMLETERDTYRALPISSNA